MKVTPGSSAVIAVLLIAFAMVLTPLFKLYTIDYIVERSEFSAVDIYRMAGQVKEFTEERGRSLDADRVKNDDGLLKMIVVMLATVGIFFGTGFAALAVSSGMLAICGSGLAFWRTIRVSLRLCFWGNALLFLCLVAADRYIVSGMDGVEIQDIMWIKSGFWVLGALAVIGAAIADVQTLRLRRARSAERVQKNET